MIISLRVARCLCAALFATLLLAEPAAHAATSPRTVTGTARLNSRPLAVPPGLHLTASPSLVDVGEDVTFVVSARSWPAPASVSLSFVSPHHGFTGQMVWVRSCSCFEIAVALARRIHPIETARTAARVRSGKTVVTASTTFMIRGLAPNGRDYAPGGTPSLTGWVSDPQPVRNQTQHFCAWVKTQDGLGVRGFRVRFVVHYPARTQQWNAGVTGSSGILCSYKSIGNAKIGATVNVDIYAGNMHVRTIFVPRSG